MKKALLFLLFCAPFMLLAQTVSLDFETPETTTDFQIFGGDLEGVITMNIANPDASGINTSATVCEGKKAADAPDWGGMFTNPAPAQGIDASQGGQVCFDIWSSNAVPVLLKLENDDASNIWELSASSVGNSAWETLCYDLTANGNGGAPAAGLYTKFVVFYDFGTVGTGTEQVFYVDNFTVPTVSNTTCLELYNFEPTAPDSFSTFGATDTTLTAAQFIIPNPGPDAVNGSNMVMKYTKMAAAQTWAGLYLDMAGPIDANTAYEVCLDYWSPTAGTLLFKLENGPDTWETSQMNATAGGWETLCFDLSADDMGGNASGPATGRSFTRMVLFADFGNEGGADDVDYYFDNFLVKSDFTVSDYMVTFAVDMNGQAGNFTQPYVSGTMNNWCGDCDAMDDADGDGVWTLTMNVPQGAHEFKFTADNWTIQEMFEGTSYSCTATDGTFTNRSIVVVADATFGTYCYNSCYACGDAVTITVNMGQGNETPAAEGFYVAGGGNFGNPGDNPMDDSDGDGVWTASFEREVGFSSFHTFTNGACGDYSCKENIAGQDCADPDNFNDRFIPAVTQDTTINTCFGFCSDNLECGDAALRMVTFEVDMNNYPDAFTTAYVAGQFNNWSGDANPMDDSDGDGVWALTLELLPGSYEYKFELDNWAVDEQFTEGDPCTQSDGTFVNRLLEVADMDMSFCFKWNTCNDCSVGVDDLAYANDLFTVQPTAINNLETTLSFGTDFRADKEVSVINGLGQVVYTESISANYSSKVLALPALADGIYFINVKSEDKHKTARILITQ